MDERLEREIIELHSGVCSALSDPPKRIMILYTLASGPRNVSELSEELRLPQPTTSRHLKVLRERDLVNTERSGAAVIYTLADPKLIEALDLLRAVLRGIYTKRVSVLEDRI
jgi:DNA-binding transcriptional ArsR family regulator